MTWLDLLDDPRSVQSIFNFSPPSLEDVCLHEIIFQHDGPRISLRFDIKEFPKSPPPKWSKSGFNTVQIRLTLGGVKDVWLKGWTKGNNGEIEITGTKGEEIQIKFVANGVDFSARGLFVLIDKISAHINLEREIKI